MNTPPGLKQRLLDWDSRTAVSMERWGHRVHRVNLAIVFLWFGALKVLGHKSATSLIGHTVYVLPEHIAVPLLGYWEIAIACCLLYLPALRIAILLLLIRLPGTLAALLIKQDICFIEFPWVPSVEGQYLIKDFLLFGAALVIGGTVDYRRRRRDVLP